MNPRSEIVIGATHIRHGEVADDALLWRGSSDGVYVATVAQATRGQWLRLNAMDGMPEDMMSQRSFADTDGSVWMGTAG